MDIFSIKDKYRTCLLVLHESCMYMHVYLQFFNTELSYDSLIACTYIQH